MASGEALLNIMKSVAKEATPESKTTGLIYGTVTSGVPDIKIKIQGDNNLELDESFLVLSSFCYDKWFEIPEWHTYPETDHTHAVHDTYTGGGTSDPTTHHHTIPGHRVLVWRGLRTGDKVLMLRYTGGNRYFVLQHTSPQDLETSYTPEQIDGGEY